MAYPSSHPIARQRAAAVVRITMLAIVLSAFALRLYRLDAQELRGDEAFGYFFSLRSFKDIIQSTIDLMEPHPIASYFVQHLWLDVAGHSAFALRFSSVCFNLLAVALLYRLAICLSLRNSTALLGAFLLAISPYAIWHSQDARMYSMSLCLTIATVWLAVEWLQRQRLVYAIAYVILATLALYTHYYAVYVLLALYVFVLSRALLFPGLQNSVLSLLIPLFFIALLYAPWYERASTILQNYRGNGDSPSLLEMLQRALGTFVLGDTLPIKQAVGWAMIASCALLIAIIPQLGSGRGRRRSLWLLACYLALPLLVTWFGARSRPIFNERYLVAALPPFLLLVASGCEFWWWKWRATLPDDITHSAFDALNPIQRKLKQPSSGFVVMATALHGLSLLLLILGMGIGLNQTYFSPEASKTRGWQALAITLRNFSSGIDPAHVRMVQSFPDPVLWFYTGDTPEHLVLPPLANDLTAAQAEVTHLYNQDIKRIVLAVQPAPNWDNQGIAQQALSDHYDLAHETQVANWPVQVYMRKSQPLTPLEVRFVNGLQLSGFGLQPSGLPAGGLLIVQLDWQGDEAKLTGTEKVTVQVLNEMGALVAQVDQRLDDIKQICTYGVALPAALTGGSYRVIVAVYDPGLAGAPRVRTVDGREAVEVSRVGVY